MDRRTTCSSLLGICIWLATTPVLAQAEPERIQLIISGLPPRNSATYKAIAKLAGVADRQPLPLTKTEIWSVPSGNLKALRKETAQYGVGVRQVAGDWNHIFRSAPANTTFSDKQKALLEEEAASKATLGVAIMATPDPPMVEYALTKDMGSASPSKNAAKLVVRLSKSTVLTITRSSVQIASSMCTWRGRVDGTGAPVTLLWWPSGKMAGAVRHNGRIYSIRHLGGEIHAIIEMRRDRMPPIHAPVPQRTRVDQRDWRRV